MRAIVQSEAGGPEQCQLGEHEKPLLAASDVCIRVHYAGLNPADYKLMTRGFPGWDWPHIPGLDGSGEIVACGEEVTHLKTGQRVAWHGSLKAQGSCADFICVPAGCVAVLPGDMTCESAAAVPCAGLTAYQLIAYKLPLPGEGRSALVHAGAGGVGGFAIQLLAQNGVEVITTCSSANNEYCQSLGATICIDYNELDEDALTAAVMQASGGRGVDIAINTLNRDSATADMQRLAFGGHLCFVAGQPHFDQFKAFSKALSFHEAALGAAHLANDVEAIADIGKMLGELLHMIDAGRIQLLQQETVSAEDVPQALQRLSERHVRGKLVADFT